MFSTHKTKLKFKNYSNILKPLAVIHGDFVAINEKINIKQEFKNLLEKNEKLDIEWNNYNYIYNINGKK